MGCGGENTLIKVNGKDIGPQVTAGTEEADFHDGSLQVGREDKIRKPGVSVFGHGT